jgi:hypothetical protein
MTGIERRSASERLRKRASEQVLGVAAQKRPVADVRRLMD